MTKTSKRHIYTEEQYTFLLDKTAECTDKELRDMFNKQFDTSLSVSAIQGFKYRHNLKKDNRVKLYKCTDEQIEFIRNNVKGISYKELTNIFNSKYGTKLTESQISSCISRNKFTNGLDGKLTKGHNKGVRFKKGCKPTNELPIGAERLTFYKFTKVKTTEGEWRKKHIVIWEEYHKRKVPENHIVIFADGDKTNFNIENLLLVSRKEYTTMLTNELMFDNTELTQTGKLIAGMKIKVKEIEQNSNKKDCLTKE